MNCARLLTLVQGYAQMVQMKARDNKDFAKYAKGIMDGSTRMMDIIDNLLDVSRIDSNLLDVKATDVEIVNLVERAEETFKESLQERGMTLVTQGLADLPPVKADTEHVVQGLLPCHRERHQIHAGRRLHHCQRQYAIRERNQKPEVEIKVKDTGIGIDPQYHELVFEKFYQTGEVLLHSSGKTKFKGGGPGLGLAIARGIMDAHRGRIWLNSPGHNEETHPGTTVFIRLPADGSK
jgi:signal transduction histidine kinase